jgi:hypothetical protein
MQQESGERQAGDDEEMTRGPSGACGRRGGGAGAARQIVNTQPQVKRPSPTHVDLSRTTLWLPPRSIPKALVLILARRPALTLTLTLILLALLTLALALLAMTLALASCRRSCARLHKTGSTPSKGTSGS